MTRTIYLDTLMCLDTSILAKSNMGRREYLIRAESYVKTGQGIYNVNRQTVFLH
jgi:hypothetical protein